MKLNRKEYFRINQILRERNIHWDQTKHLNCIRQHPIESDAHFDEKVKLCRQLYKQGHPFITEVWTTDRKMRFDILDLHLDEDIEVEKSRSSKKYKGDKEIKIGGNKHGK